MKFRFSGKPMTKVSILVITVFINITFAFSQEKKSEYNLLWQITGNGLTKPSYLFGSMHVKDRRAFNFSDSVLKAISSSNALVLEVHPDSLVKSMMNLSKKSDVKKRIESLLSEEQRSELIKRFEVKNGYTPDSALLNNPILISNLMTVDHSKSDDMPTFIDAYLYGIARTMNKNIYGLENPEDQSNLLFGNDEKINNLFDQDEELETDNFEKMVKIYASGNLQDITAFLTEDDEEALDLIPRNKIMTDGIMTLIKKDNLFAVIGAAHMLGENGVINLLKKAGYNLHPVQATFTGITNSYKINYSKMNWVKYTDAVDNFEVEFPSQPFVNKKITSRAVICSDIAINAVLSVNSSYTGPLNQISSKQYLDTVFTSYLKDQKNIISKKSGNRYGGTSLEVELKTGAKFARLILLHKDNTFYILSVENDVNNLHDSFVEKFFNSFKTTSIVPTKEKKWVDFKHDKGAFSVKFPFQPEENIQEVAPPDAPNQVYVMNIYTVFDKINQLSYLVKYNDFPEGMYLADKQTVFKGLEKQFLSKGKLADTAKVVFKDGYEGREIGLELQGTYMKIQFFLRGNRCYLLMKQNQKGLDKFSNDDFFDSFKIEKYTSDQSNIQTLNGINLFLPTAAKQIGESAQEKDEEEDFSSYIENYKSYYSYNKNTGGVYSIEIGQISKYFKIKDADSLYTSILNRIKAETDSFSKIEHVKVGTTEANIYTYSDQAAGTERKIKIWLNGRNFYYLSLISTKEEIESQQGIDFFDKIEMFESQQPFILNSSKAKILFTDLRSTDKDLQKRAQGALDFYAFDKAEIPLMIAATKFKLQDDTLENGTRIKLIRKLDNLEPKKNTLLYKQLYNDVNNNDLIRAEAFSKIVQSDSTQYTWYLKSLIENKPLELPYYRAIFKPLSDSLNFVSKHFDQILTLLDKKQYHDQMIDLISDMAVDKTNAIYSEQIQSRQTKILKNAMVNLDTYLSDTEKENGVEISNYLTILSVIKPTKLTEDFTNKLIADTIPYMTTMAISTRIKTGLPIDEKLMSAQLDSLSSRYQIINAYEAIGKLASVPAKYRAHEEVAKMLLYHYFGDEYDYPEESKLLGKIIESDKVYYAFEAIFHFDGKKKSYIGVCGPFDDKSDKLTIDDYTSYSDLEDKADDWLAQAKAIIKVMEE